MSFDRRVRDWVGHIVENADKALGYVEGLSFEAWATDSKRVWRTVTEALPPLREGCVRALLKD